MFSAGIDCGAKNTRAIILVDDKIVGKAQVLTGFDQRKAVEEAFERAVKAAGIAGKDLERIAATGSGKDFVEIADNKINEIRAMAKAASHFFPAARTVVDIGAEGGRIAKINEKGKVVDFVINEKCAAGAGSFIEAMARALEVAVEEIGALCSKSTRKISMNAQCAIFAESEVVGLIHARVARTDISRAIHDAVASRVVSMVRRIGINEEVVLLGGLGRNSGFVDAMVRELKIGKVLIPLDPEYGAAVGAALLSASEEIRSTVDGSRKGRVPARSSRDGHAADTQLAASAEIRSTAECYGSPTDGKNREKKEQEFWRWKESTWKNPGVDWKEAQVISVGVDVGSVSSQAVIMADEAILAYSNVRTGCSSPDSGAEAVKLAMEAVGEMSEDRIDCTIATGYGRANMSFADRTVTEIACHARGANFIYGHDVRTVLDIGGQDIKVIRCDERGKVTNFLMNDKCAAGTGRGMEVIADLLGVPLTEVGDRSFLLERESEAISNTCVVYAKSEAISLLRRGWTINEVLAAYCRAMAERIYSLLERVGIAPGFAVTGGMAKNRGVVDRLVPMIGLERMKTIWDTQIAGAVGAALLGSDQAMRLKLH